MQGGPHSRRSRRPSLAIALVLALLSPASTGCDLPIDPEGTLDRVRGGTMLVGVVHHPPWAVVREGREPEGIEVALVKRLASDLDAEVDWIEGGETGLMLDLERHRLDLVVGGIARQTHWNGRVALSRPHAQDDDRPIVLACPPGENGWLLWLDRRIDRLRRDGDPAGEGR